VRQIGEAPAVCDIALMPESATHTRMCILHNQAVVWCGDAPMRYQELIAQVQVLPFPSATQPSRVSHKLGSLPASIVTREIPARCKTRQYQRTQVSSPRMRRAAGRPAPSTDPPSSLSGAWIPPLRLKGEPTAQKRFEHFENGAISFAHPATQALVQREKRELHDRSATQPTTAGRGQLAEGPPLTMTHPVKGRRMTNAIVSTSGRARQLGPLQSAEIARPTVAFTR
jgi:hypothetical protein